MASVTYENVSKRFNDTAAVRDLNLEIHDGEFIVLVGPSGCGKSTTLRMLAGLEEATEGDIRIGDRVINDVAPRDRDIAMVFQSYALYPHMSVFDNMAFGLKMRHVPKDEIQTKVREVAKMLALDALLARKPGQLSGGQRQRVALGRAIVRSPQVFLLDEPLSNLDAALRVETRINLQRLHRDLQTTFIYVTHDQVEAMTMGDRIAVMREGVLQQVSAPTDLYDRPANMYVAGFIGSPRMNFIPVTIQGTTATASGFTMELPKVLGVEKAVLGLRPEDMSDGNGALDVELRVDVTEVLGSDEYLYGKVGADDVIGRVDPHFRTSPGDKVPLHINTQRIHVFDAETERALL
ncbi:MAG: ABC transporter ATP-binding protein [Chloroflexota bacterium]